MLKHKAKSMYARVVRELAAESAYVEATAHFKPGVPSHLKNTLGFWFLWVQLVGLDDIDIPLGLVHWQ